MRLGCNLSTMFTERRMAERFAAARAAGFDAVEIQFPDEHDLGALSDAAAAADLPVVLINIPRGGPGEVGLAALPGREADFAAAVETCLPHARALGVAKVNALAGRPDGADPAACARTLTSNLRRAADRFGAAGIAVVVEPINPGDVPGFFLDGLAPALDALDRADHPNLSLQFDLYHMAITEPDLAAAIAGAGPRIGHLQFADAPGRHEPGSGATNFTAALRALRQAGNDSAVMAEYRPTGRTEDTLNWMADFRDRMR